ncbi:extracellular serine/threonine protein CG31145-like isoform X2 [Sitodiplosis mosellana]|uniref:extracellular serine/threonine protein CG31145-like isoform X2 n=1 Tax=Sitodiplosis mosellana TaxID=263140 RepID=UPI002443DB5A|nr:extracellular serine/threonine protein CG31145-like isoform X2 [Sitodiplosis mosellana]
MKTVCRIQCNEQRNGVTNKMFVRLRRSIFIGFSVFVVVITIILIGKIHNDIRFTSDYLLTPKFDLATNFQPNIAECQRKLSFNFLTQTICPVKDLYHDLQDAIEYIESKEPPQTDSQSEKVVTLSDFFSIGSKEELTVLDKFNLAIKQTELYSANSTLVDELLHDMSTRKIVRVYEKNGGTQIKFRIIFDNGMFAIAKPMRFPRDWEIFPNQIQYAEFERHTAEIAAYHLDRILGFRRTMPVIGRILNVTSEIFEIANRNLTNTFFMSPEPEHNYCFYGTCKQYCSIHHPVCANGDLIETAFIAYLPFYFDAEVVEYQHPWRKSYDRKRKAIWERDPKYCDRVKRWEEYKEGRRLLDLMDLSLFDFLTGNKDRHHYAVLKSFGKDTFFLNYDNGRAFGRSYYDEIMNLMPLSQCCVIRSSTLKTLLSFHNGPKPLSQLMRESMASDPLDALAPVLWEPHLEALDRRVDLILSTFRKCIKTSPIDDVIYSRDNFGVKSLDSTQDF